MIHTAKDGTKYRMENLSFSSPGITLSRVDKPKNGRDLKRERKAKRRAFGYRRNPDTKE